MAKLNIANCVEYIHRGLIPSENKKNIKTSIVLISVIFGLFILFLSLADGGNFYYILSYVILNIMNIVTVFVLINKNHYTIADRLLASFIANLSIIESFTLLIVFFILFSIGPHWILIPILLSPIIPPVFMFIHDYKIVYSDKKMKKYKKPNMTSISISTAIGAVIGSRLFRMSSGFLKGNAIIIIFSSLIILINICMSFSFMYLFRLYCFHELVLMGICKKDAKELKWGTPDNVENDVLF